MTHKLAGKISLLLLNRNVIESEDVDIYQYGFEVLFDAVFETLLILVLGITINKLFATVIFIITFTTLRKYSGGHHANTKVLSTLQTLMVYVFAMVFVYVEPANVITYMLSVISLVIVWWLAPVAHTNKELDEETIIINRRKSRILSFIYLGIVVISSGSYAMISNVISITFFEVAILILLRGGSIYVKNVKCS